MELFMSVMQLCAEVITETMENRDTFSHHHFSCVFFSFLCRKNCLRVYIEFFLGVGKTSSNLLRIKLIDFFSLMLIRFRNTISYKALRTQGTWPIFVNSIAYKSEVVQAAPPQFMRGKSLIRSGGEDGNLGF